MNGTWSPLMSKDLCSTYGGTCQKVAEASRGRKEKFQGAIQQHEETFWEGIGCSYLRNNSTSYAEIEQKLGLGSQKNRFFHDTMEERYAYY